MDTIRSYFDLEVWKQSMDLTCAIYEVTKAYPKEEIFGLTNQMRRASVSVPSNIAEGFGRGFRKDYKRHLLIARGSLCEMETQLTLGSRLNFTSKKEYEEVWQRSQVVGRLLNGLLRAL